jgi:hypothetical protein
MDSPKITITITEDGVVSEPELAVQDLVYCLESAKMSVLLGMFELKNPE